MTTIGLAVICGPGDSVLLPRLLASVLTHVDQLAILDTTRAREVDTASLPWGTRTGTFDWIDDFAAARNAADELLTTDYVVTADADEVIVGAEHFRALSAQANGLALWGMQHNVMPDDAEDVFVVQPWIVARGTAPWRSAVHEVRDAPVQAIVRPEVARRLHDAYLDPRHVLASAVRNWGSCWRIPIASARCSSSAPWPTSTSGRGSSRSSAASSCRADP